MTEYAPTDELGLVLPVVSSGQAWSTQKYVVDNFNKVDDAFTADRARIAKAEQYLKGTSAQRSTFYGTDPSTPTDRGVAANQFRRWFNTEKGYWQLYHAQFDDPGVTAATPAKKTAGWKPVDGRVPLSVFSVAASNNPANVKKYGAQVEVVGGTTSAIVLDNVFTSDFDEYEIEFEITSVTAGLNLQFLLRAAGANVSASVYNSQFMQMIGSSAGGAWSTNQPQVGLPAISPTEGALVTIRITNPASTDWKRALIYTGSGSVVQQMFTTIKSNTACDAFVLGVSANAFNPGSRVRVYGISNGI
jgi:hypothetical protein